MSTNALADRAIARIVKVFKSRDPHELLRDPIYVQCLHGTIRQIASHNALTIRQVGDRLLNKLGRDRAAIVKDHFSRWREYEIPDYGRDQRSA